MKTPSMRVTAAILAAMFAFVLLLSIVVLLACNTAGSAYQNGNGNWNGSGSGRDEGGQDDDGCAWGFSAEQTRVTWPGNEPAPTSSDITDRSRVDEVGSDTDFDLCR